MLKYLPHWNLKNNNNLFGTSTKMKISTRVTMGMNSLETGERAIVWHWMYVYKNTFFYKINNDVYGQFELNK